MPQEGRNRDTLVKFVCMVSPVLYARAVRAFCDSMPPGGCRCYMIVDAWPLCGLAPDGANDVVSNHAFGTPCSFQKRARESLGHSLCSSSTRPGDEECGLAESIYEDKWYCIHIFSAKMHTLGQRKGLTHPLHCLFDPTMLH